MGKYEKTPSGSLFDAEYLLMPTEDERAVLLRPFKTTEADDVAMLVTVNHWWTKRRVRDVQGAGFGYRRLLLCDWPREWPVSGFQLGCMHVQRAYQGPLTIERLDA